MLEPGEIVRFYYLWARQAATGEETGRKARPACVVVRNKEALFLIPITSQEPHATRAKIAVPEIECRRGGLKFPSWAIVDEYNRVQLDQAYDFESLAPVGRFGASFMRRVAEAIKGVAAQRKMQGVLRK